MNRSTAPGKHDDGLRVPDGSTANDSRGCFSFSFNGEFVTAMEGDTVAAALWARGIKVFRQSPRTGAPRGVFCAMGVCQECVVRVNGRVCTSCNTPAEPGMDVQSFSLYQVDGAST